MEGREGSNRLIVAKTPRFLLHSPTSRGVRVPQPVLRQLGFTLKAMLKFGGSKRC